VLGAHTGGFNVDSFGVSLLGDFSTVPPSDTTMATAVEGPGLEARRRLPRPAGQGGPHLGGRRHLEVPRRPAGDLRRRQRPPRRRQHQLPGRDDVRPAPALRSSVAADLGPNLVDPVVSGPTSLPVGSTGPLVLRAGTLQGLPWTASVTDSSGALLRAASGTGGQASLRWDLTDAAGRPVKPGTYALRISGGAAGVVPYVRTVVVGDPPCRGRPLDRAVCQTRTRTARR
jgi:hypothetical protein